MKKKIVVVGGGISGLSAVYYLRKKIEEKGYDADILLLEKSDRFGGQIKTEYIEDFVIEGGPDCMIRDKPWALQLCRELDIEDRLINTNDENKETYIFSKGKLHPLPDGLLLLVPSKFLPFATTGLFTLKGKLRMAMEFLIPPRRDDSDETLAGFVKRRFGRELLDKIAEPLIAGIHAGDPEKMSLQSTFPRFLQQEKDYGSLTKSTLVLRKKMNDMMKKKNGISPERTFFVSFKKGMNELVDNLVKNLDGVDLEKGKGVSDIEIRNDGKYDIRLENGEIIDAHVLVLTTASYITSGLLKNINTTIAESLKDIPYIKTGTVTIAYRKEDLKDLPKAFGFLIPGIEKRKIMAATFTSLKWPFRCPDDYFLIRCFIGGKNNQDMIEKDDETIIHIVREELKHIIRLDAEPHFYRIFRWIDNMPQYNIGHPDILNIIDKETSKQRGLYLTGSAYRGIGIPDCIHNARLTADKIVENINF